MPSRQDHSQKGFTIVELAIVVPILIVTVIVLFESLFSLVRSSALNRTAIDITYETQNALSAIENDTILTNTFLPTTDSAVTDPYKPTTHSGQWSYLGNEAGDPNRVLILRVYNTTGNPLSVDRKPAFLTDEGCDPSTIYFNEVLQYNLIYFVQNGTLYRRHALDTTKSTCETPYQKQSCPSLATLGLPSRHTACAADDEVVARNVREFSVQYYPSKNSTTPIAVYEPSADPDAVTAAAAVDVSLTLARPTYGQDVSNSSSIRIAKVNAPITEE